MGKNKRSRANTGPQHRGTGGSGNSHREKLESRKKRKRKKQIKKLLGRGETFPFATPPQPIRGAMQVWAAAEWGLIRRGIKRPGRMPDIIGIGAQKAGSSWLWRELDRHPQIAMAQPKELHYFDRFPWTPISRYARKFELAARRKGAACRLTGEITPAYGILPIETIRKIHTLSPDARVVFLMRQPIERAWSMLRMDLAKRRKRRVGDVATDEFLAVINKETFTARGDYITIIDNWLKVYPREQVFIDFFDRVEEAPAALMREIYAFVGVEPPEQVDEDSLAKKRFVSPEGEMPPEVYERLVEIYAPEIERLGERFGDMPDSWRINASV